MASGWPVDWQSWPLESDAAGSLPSSHVDITQGSHVQDQGWEKLL